MRTAHNFLGTADPIFGAHLRVAIIAINEQRRRTDFCHHAPELHNQEALSLIGQAACHHDGFNLIATKAQVNTELVQGFCHIKGQFRHIANHKFFHACPPFACHVSFFICDLRLFFFLICLLKSPRSPSGIVASG